LTKIGYCSRHDDQHRCESLSDVVSFLGYSSVIFYNIPPEIALLTNLQELRIYRNELRAIPTEIGLLTNLDTLSLHHNQLRNVPPEIGLLTKLRILYLDNNLLEYIPKEIAKLPNLCRFDLHVNPLRSIPIEFSRLGALVMTIDSTQESLVPCGMSVRIMDETF
jgi:Leucine-rich repeat (LRR) protein